MKEPAGLVEEGFELLDVGVAMFDTASRLVYCNPAFRGLRRYPEDVCRKGATLESLLRFNAERGDFGPGDTESQVAERLAEITKVGEREIEREMADGQILGIRYRHTVSGGLLVTHEDRTAERRAQAALATSEERYALVAEAAEEAIYEWDIEAERFFASPRLVELLGRDTAEGGVRDWSWEGIIHSDDRQHYKKTLEKHLSGEVRRWDCEYRLRDATGAWRWVSDHGTSIRDKDGRAVRMVAAIRDITERVEKDAALAASEERHMLVTQATSDGIYDWNVVEDLLFVSENLTRLLDFDLDVKASRMWSERVHPQDCEHYAAATRTHFKGETDAIDCEYRVRSKGGDYRWVHDRGVAMRNRDGRVIRLVGAVRDITEIKEARAELDRTEAQLVSSLATIADGILLVDAESRVQLWNDRYREIFSEAAGGADLKEVIVKGRPFFDMIRDGYNLGMFNPHADGVEGWVETRRRAWEREVSRHEMKLSNGTWILVNERRLPDGGHISAYTDITELKRREEESQAARTRFEEAIEAISTGFALFDAEDRLVIWNSRFRDYFAEMADVFTPGARFKDMIEAGIERGLFPEANSDPEKFLGALLEKRSKGIGLVRENLLGNDMWLQITDHRTKDGGIVSIYTDVTELKNKQKELEEQSAILEMTLENMDQGISMVDRELRMMAMNRKFLELIGFPEERFGRGFSMEEGFRFNAERGEYGPGDVEEQVRERVELAKQFLPHKFERTRPDGTVLQVVGKPIDGGGFVSTYTDVTELKQREAEILGAKDAAERALADLRRAQEQLIQAEKMASLGQLTAGIAHEIKNPLNFVNNFAKLSDELLEELSEILEAPFELIDEETREDAEDLFRTVRENLAKVNQHGNRADSIVKNMLSHAREGPRERQRVDLNAIAEEALNLAYHGARAEHPGMNIEMSKTLSPEVGKIECFPQDLMRVFLNLISNGIYAANLRCAEADFSPTISLSTCAHDDLIEIEVRDNGTGISPEIQEKIFLPFFTTKPTGEGTGLGLSLSYDIVAKGHGGNLTVESEEGEFTAFRITLPRVLPAVEEVRP